MIHSQPKFRQKLHVSVEWWWEENHPPKAILYSKKLKKFFALIGRSPRRRVAWRLRQIWWPDRRVFLLCRISSANPWRHPVEVPVRWPWASPIPFRWQWHWPKPSMSNAKRKTSKSQQFFFLAWLSNFAFAYQYIFFPLFLVISWSWKVWWRLHSRQASSKRSLRMPRFQCWHSSWRMADNFPGHLGPTRTFWPSKISSILWMIGLFWMQNIVLLVNDNNVDLL